ncbi:MAG: DUF2177 family protein [Chitinophagales bacterium]
MKYVLLIIIIAALLLALDLLWLGVVAKNFYKEKLGFIFNGEFNTIPAVVFYTIYIFGILYFCQFPAISAHSWKLALINGIFLGFLCYATYDLTNMATIQQWPVSVVIVDIIWGTFLTASVSVLSYLIAIKWLHF